MSAKTIKINPDIFKVSGNSKTRKKKEKIDVPQIKVKSPSTKNKNTSTLKRNLLKMFRNHYDSKMAPPTSTAPATQANSNNDISHVIEKHPINQTDFTSTLDYFKDLSERTEHATKATAIATKVIAKPTQVIPQSVLHNNTIRRNPTLQTPVSTSVQQMPLPPTLSHAALPSPQINEAPIMLRQPVMVPQYGCMKNGNLPTYRTWRHATQKQYPTLPNSNQQNIPKIPVPHKESLTMDASKVPTQMYENKLNDQLREMTKREEWRNRSFVKPQNHNHKIKKQKRIIRRTFHVGKSKQHPRVSVLVSNRTIRNQTNLKKSELKQTPIQDVKKYLLKQGFIRVGTTTPVDVLRQMYENAQMICGEIKNHNPDNLLYNYLNQADNDAF